MSSGKNNPIISHLKGILGPGSRGDLLDEELLEKFVTHQDENAFAMLLRRHGAMVWGVCRRLLTHRQDSEDAFQATFLVLACKAASIGQRKLVANWLFGVARRAALNLRVRRARRAQREQLCGEPPDIPAPLEKSWNEGRGVLDEELARVPAKYRLPLLLCGLEGMTHEEAGKCLGWPTGTVAGRLSRGRVLLRSQLLRRGITAPVAGALTVMAAAAPAAAVVSPQLAAASVRGAMALVAAGKTAVVDSPVVAALMHQVILKMFLARLLKTTIVIAAMAMTLAGAGVIWHGNRSTEPITSEDVGKHHPGPLTHLHSVSDRLAGPRAGPVTGKPALTLPSNPNDVVFRMDRSVDSVRAPGMVLTIFADGRVIAEVPEGLSSLSATDLTKYEKEQGIAGDIDQDAKRQKAKVLEGKLSNQELEELLRFALHEQEFFNFDPAAVKAAIRDKYQSDGKVTDNNDATTTGFHIQTAERNHEVQWRQLAKAAWDFPQVERLLQLQAVEWRLSHVFYVLLGGGQERVKEVAAQMTHLAQPYYRQYPDAPRLTAADLFKVTPAPDGSRAEFTFIRNKERTVCKPLFGISINVPQQGDPTVTYVMPPQ
jgi:RNA polymerase sigma factor (sigma-70 family)